MTARTRTRLRAWLGRNAAEFRMGVLLVAVGAPVSISGAVLYVLPGPGFPVLLIGLACLVTGLVMVGANASGRSRR
ncbi:hypothetical protein [Streptomyces virginiae]|uniref:hypothetical protein n=1 Tax=Streptomyces virginiae TaxID=1961 RepID=UPI0036C1CD91